MFDCYTTRTENDLKVGGKFLSRMEAKDGSFGVDFGGTYDEVLPRNHIAYTLDDTQKVEVDFNEHNGQNEIISTFNEETENPLEM